MAKIKYNVKGVERKTFVEPEPGLYEMVIEEAEYRDSDGKNDIKLSLKITENNDKFVGSMVFTYVNLGESSQWKLAELTDALGMPESGEIDTIKMKGKKLKVKVNADSYNGEYRARAGRLAPLEARDEEVGAADDPDAGAADDPDAGTATASAGDGETIVVERNNVELSTDPGYYDDWSDQDAFDEIENQGINLGRKKKTKANVIAALIELVQSEAGGDGEAEAATEGDKYDDTDEWTDAALAAEYKKRELDTIEGKKNRAKVIEALRADDSKSGDDDPFAD